MDWIINDWLIALLRAKTDAEHTRAEAALRNALENQEKRRDQHLLSMVQVLERIGLGNPDKRCEVIANTLASIVIEAKVEIVRLRRELSESRLADLQAELTAAREEALGWHARADALRAEVERWNARPGEDSWRLKAQALEKKARNVTELKP